MFAVPDNNEKDNEKDIESPLLGQESPLLGQESPLLGQQSHPAPRTPFKPGQLVGPGEKTGKYMHIQFSPIDENLWWIGAEPEHDHRFVEQMKFHGLCSRSMFLSCACFAVPAIVHLCIMEHFMDILAVLVLLTVAVSSSTCDSICVHANVFEHGPPYVKTAAAVGKSTEWVQQHIKDHGALPEVLACDRWNNFSRSIDRFVCVVLVFPCMIAFAFHQRSWQKNLPFLFGFAIAWGICGVDQKYRRKLPCGIKRTSQGWTTEKTYDIHMRLHELWHWILILLLIINALWRHQPKQ